MSQAQIERQPPAETSPVTIEELRQLVIECAVNKLLALETKAVTLIPKINNKIKAATIEERTYCYFNADYESVLAKYYPEFKLAVLRSGTVMVSWTLQEMSDGDDV